MNNFVKTATLLLIVLYFPSFASTGYSPDKAEKVKEIIYKVNRYWQENNTKRTNPFWHNATYHTGNMEAYFLTGDENFRKYSENWAEQNEWKGAKSDNKEEWKYSPYGYTQDFVLFGDYQACFQTYIDLYNLAPDSVKIARTLEVMEYQIETPNNDYIWWSDGFYMVLPVLTKLYKLTNDQR